MKKKICLLVMISLIISNIYCGEEDAVESLIEAVGTERKLVLQENDYEIQGEEEGGKRGIYIKILNEDIAERIDANMVEPGIIYINGEARFVIEVIWGQDRRDPIDPLTGWSPDYVWIYAIGMKHVVILQENDYGIFSITNSDFLEIVILNENKMKRIKEADAPTFIIYIDGSVKFVKGMSAIASNHPYPPCDYVYFFGSAPGDTYRKAIFDYGILLFLRNELSDYTVNQERQQIFLEENDYEIIGYEEGRPTIKILNKDKLKEIRKAVNIEIDFYMNNDEIRFAEGMKASDLRPPSSCNYTFKINANNKVIFSNLKRDSLVLTPIEEHLIKYLETLNIQHDIQYEKGLIDGKEHINVSNIILIIFLVAIGGFITYWIASRRKA